MKHEEGREGKGEGLFVVREGKLDERGIGGKDEGCREEGTRNCNRGRV